MKLIFVFILIRHCIVSDSSDTDGDNEDVRVVMKDGMRYPDRSWYFIHNSTIKGTSILFYLKLSETYSFSCFPDFHFVLGYVSMRSPNQGSLFIQELCKTLNERWQKDDLGTIAAYVNRNIMREFDCQAPEIVNQLGDLVFFKGLYK